MGLGGKLNFAFFSVLTIAVGTHVGIQIYGEHLIAQQNARAQVQPIVRALKSEAGTIQQRNEALAERLSADSAFSAAYAAQNRNALAAAIKSFSEKSGLTGFVTVFDGSGKVFYSGDAPLKFGYEPHDIADEIRGLMRDGRVWYGPAAPTYTDQLCIIGMVPIRGGGSSTGMVAVCQPVDNPFLTGLREKVKLEDGIQHAELLLYSVKDERVTAMTPGLVSGDNGIVTALNREGHKILGDKPEVERAGRFWTVFRFETSTHRPLAYLAAGAPLPDEKTAYITIGGEGLASMVAGILLAMMFSGAIAGGWNRNMRFLVQRAKDLAAQRQDIPALDGLNRDFLELAEVIDTAVSGNRISVKQLQSQVGRHNEELAEKTRLVEEANNKVEAVNRQLTIQSKQLSEVSKQINQANTQSVLLQQKLASVLQISTEGYLILDAYGNVLAANPTFLNWIGVAETELAGRHCFELVRKPGEARDNGNMGAFSVHGGEPGDLINQFFPEGVIFHRFQDTYVEVILHLQPVMMDDANIHGYIMVMRDKAGLQGNGDGDRIRGEMVSILQDSIRAPLAVAEQKWGRVLSGTKQQNSQIGNTLVDLHLTYQQLLGVVDSLLMMHTGIVPTTPVLREQISIARLIGDCMEQAAQQAREQQVMLDYKTVTGLPTTAVDADLIRDAFSQLLDKMISITAPGGRVRVESSSKNNEIRTSIVSSGPALPQAEVEDMFAGFVQGKHAEDSYSQRLSMYLVRNNIERIGGRIWIESDRGTHIYVVLPIQ